jgi:flagellar protein FlaG
MEPATAFSHLQPISPKASVQQVTDAATGAAASSRGAFRIAGDGPAVPTVSPTASSEEFAASERGEDRQTEVAHAVENMNDFFQMVRRTLQFSLDEESGRVLVKIKDAETDEVIRQIPSEEILRLAKSLDEFKDGFKGLLLEEKA